MIAITPSGGDRRTNGFSPSRESGRRPPKHAIPIHYGTFPTLAGTPAEYIEALGAAGIQVHALQPGEAATF
ncbi:MAG: hypothetical protein PHY45_12315 [Rhodocyclaceae bacterium]|nr:hypothetical protein [Rhodocyclaceae bacterium]